MQQSGWVLVRDSDYAQPAGPQLPVRATLAFQRGAAGQAGPASLFGQYTDQDTFNPAVLYTDADGWKLGAEPDGVGRGVPQADLAIDSSTGLAHIAYLRVIGNSRTGLPVHNTFDFAQGGFGAASPEVVASAEANDVAVAVDVDGVPLVAFSTTANVFVFKRDGPGCWVPYAGDGSHPPQPVAIAGLPRGIDMDVDAASGRVIVASNFYYGQDPFVANVVVLYFAAARGSWTLSASLVVGSALDITSVPLASSSISIALSPNGAPHVGATFYNLLDQGPKLSYSIHIPVDPANLGFMPAEAIYGTHRMRA